MLVAGGCGRDATSAVEKVAEQRRAQAQRAAADAGLPQDVQRFLGQAALGVAATFTVTYAGADTRTTLTQRPPERRVDVVAEDTTESFLRLRDGTYTCKQDKGRGWECSRRTNPEAPAEEDPDLGVFAPTTLKETVEALASARSSYRFSVANRRLAGTTATCLVTTPVAGGEADELCIAPSGAILRIRSRQRSLDAERYRATADPAAFRLPAPAR